MLKRPKADMEFFLAVISERWLWRSEVLVVELICLSDCGFEGEGKVSLVHAICLRLPLAKVRAEYR